jgi:hypothetical protein
MTYSAITHKQTQLGCALVGLDKSGHYRGTDRNPLDWPVCMIRTTSEGAFVALEAPKLRSQQLTVFAAFFD